ncbi:MAG: TnpV protein, partial [Clostridia bacterium]|nr:TnpV protein [Clostridia bacterium]
MKQNELTYTQNGDYLIPDIQLSETETKPLGKYGRMRKKFLQEHRPITWNNMILSETLYPHLREIDETANRR